MSFLVRETLAGTFVYQTRESISPVGIEILVVQATRLVLLSFLRYETKGMMYTGMDSVTSSRKNHLKNT
jgi:hypothetical protein